LVKKEKKTFLYFLRKGKKYITYILKNNRKYKTYIFWKKINKTEKQLFSFFQNFLHLFIHLILSLVFKKYKCLNLFKLMALLYYYIIECSILINSINLSEIIHKKMFQIKMEDYFSCFFLDEILSDKMRKRIINSYHIMYHKQSIRIF